MFQKEIDEFFSGMPNVFNIADDILITGFDKQDRVNNATFDKVLRICRQENLKANKDKCLFRCTNTPFFGEIISQHGVSLDPRREQAIIHVPPLKSKKELELFFGVY